MNPLKKRRNDITFKSITFEKLKQNARKRVLERRWIICVKTQKR